ncbi:MAG: ribonuclease P protein component [Phycisphaerales bacterium]
MTFRRDQRLQHAREFQAVRAARRSRTRGPVVVSVLPNGGKRWRLGLAVGRNAGGAVERNRIKRVVREAFRLVQHELPIGEVGGCDVVVSVRGPTRLTLEGCQRLLLETTRSMCGRGGGRDGGDGS